MNYGNLLKIKLLLNSSINKIKEYNKLRFNSDLYLPTGKLIEFRMLTININCVIEKDNKYYPELYLELYLELYFILNFI